MRRRTKDIQIFSMSALDLFASGMGAFIIIAVILFPYYLKREQVVRENELLSEKISGIQYEIKRSNGELTTISKKLKDAIKKQKNAQAKLNSVLKEQKEIFKETGQVAHSLEELKEKNKAINEEEGNFRLKNIDLVFVLDTTGSMSYIIDDLKQNLLSIVKVLHKLSPDIRIGFVAYRDYSYDDYVTQKFPLTNMDNTGFNYLKQFVDTLEAGINDKNQDFEEAVEEGLREAVSLSWQPDRAGLIAVVGDAGSREQYWETSFGYARSFRSMGAKNKVSVIYKDTRNTTGFLFNLLFNVDEIKEKDQQFFKQLAETGNGEMVLQSGAMLESIITLVLDI